MKKAVLGVRPAPQGHWVGDGFPVRSLFSYDRQPELTSPFLLLDYAGPAEFAPSATPRGVGEHPHRGFETVTIVYQGEVAHRDSTGSGGLVGPGDVQWMTAAGGILHEEFHSPAFTQQGGTLEMVQLWVNLPAAHKMSPPRYQTLRDAHIPRVLLPEDSGALRVIAGEFGTVRGPAHTFSSLNVWDLRVTGGRRAQFAIAAGHTVLIAVLTGAVRVNGARLATAAELVLLERAGEQVEIEADSDSSVLVLSGEPLAEPVIGYGPFVMNTREQITAAVQDFNNGKFGRMPLTS